MILLLDDSFTAEDEEFTDDVGFDYIPASQEQVWREVGLNTDDYVKRIFGANNYTVIDNVDKLPEKLPALFASLAA